MWGYDHGGGLMGIGMIIVWLVPIALIVWLFARSSGKIDSSDKQVRSPREILDERYARGEVGRDEYLARRTDLEGAPKT